MTCTKTSEDFRYSYQCDRGWPLQVPVPADACCVEDTFRWTWRTIVRPHWATTPKSAWPEHLWAHCPS